LGSLNIWARPIIFLFTPDEYTGLDAFLQQPVTPTRLLRTPPPVVANSTARFERNRSLS
jgi:hypothetical protein